MISCGNRSDFARGRIERALQCNVKTLLLGARAVIGEVETFLDDGVDVDELMLARALARMQQHVLDDRVGALAVLHHFFEVAAQHVRQLGNVGPRLVVDGNGRERLLQLVDQFGGKRGEVVDEIERIFDFMGDAGGQLTERGELFGLHQPVLRGAQLCERRPPVRGCAFRRFRKSRAFWIATPDCAAKVLIRSTVSRREGTGRAAAHHQHADDLVAAEQRRRQPGAKAGAQHDVVDRDWRLVCAGRRLAPARVPSSPWAMLDSSRPICCFDSAAISSRSMP